MNHQRLKSINSGLLVLLAAVAGHAALEWPTTALTIKADPKLPTAWAVYSFKNRGSEQALIKRAEQQRQALGLGVTCDKNANGSSTEKH